MKCCESDAIAAVVQVLTFFFFLGDRLTILHIRFVSIVVGNESDDNSCVAYDRGSQNRRFAKRGPRSSRFAKKGSAKQKKFGNLWSNLFQVLIYLRLQL